LRIGRLVKPLSAVSDAIRRTDTQELTGKSADLIEVLNLDEEGKTTREPVDDPLLTTVRDRIRTAGDALRTNNLPRLPMWDKHACGSCDMVGLCRERPLR
jgi:DNA helicase-2/ATP-dependent DNA helicase PcrA